MDFFDDMIAAQKLLAEVEEWKGTPFVPFNNTKRAGVDCVQLAAQLMVECGVIDGYDFGRYSLDFAAHTGRELITEWLGESARFEFLAKAAPKLGDVVVFKVGRAIAHVGVMVNGVDFVHSIQGRTVRISQLNDSTWSARVAGFWRAAR